MLRNRDRRRVIPLPKSLLAHTEKLNLRKTKKQKNRVLLGFTFWPSMKRMSSDVVSIISTQSKLVNFFYQIYKIEK